jgi:hypothetical protein
MPPGVTFEPNELVLKPDPGLLSCSFSSFAFNQDARIDLSEPYYSTGSHVEIRFVFPWVYYALALASALLGVVASLSLRPFAGWPRVGLELAVGAVAGLLLYFAFLYGLFSFAVPVRVDLASAVLLGAIGGYAGTGVYTLLKNLVPGLA